MPISLVVGLLILDLVGFLPGALLSSVVAAGVLVVMDARGLVTLNGLIRWRRMPFRRKVLVAVLEIVLFQFLVLVYLAQRVFGMVKGAFRPAAVHRRRAVRFDSALETKFDEGIPATTPLDADALQGALRALLAETRNKLPQDLWEKVHEVVSAVADVMPAYRAAGGLDAHDRFVVERTVVDYLPSAVQSYMKLPAVYRSSPLPETGGKTAGQLLSEQLDLLVQRMHQVADTAYRKDLEALLVHGRFLRSKFGPSGLDLSA